MHRDSEPMTEIPTGSALGQDQSPRTREATKVSPLDARGLVERIASPMALLEGKEHVYTAVSESYRRMIGGRDPVGLPFRVALPELAAEGFADLLDRVLATGEPVSGDGVPASWDDDGDGVSEDHVVNFVYQPVFDASERVCGVLAQVVDRTEQIRLERERAFLVEAGELLSSSLDYDATLSTLTRLAVQEIADWCAVDELRPDGTLRRIAVAHPDPEMVRLAHTLQERYPPDPNAPHGVARVLRTGEPELVPEIPDELLVRIARDEEHLRLARALGLRSYIVVPLLARGAVLGALTLVSSTPGRRYTERDLRLAEELSRRAAVAIDNARLYRDSEEARQGLEEQTIELEAQTEELQHQATQLEEIQAELEAANEELAAQVEAAERTREEAEAARALLDAFFSAAPLAVGFLDRDLRYRRVNPALAAIAGFSPAGMIGKGLHEVMPRFASELEPLYQQVLRTGEAILNREITGPRPADPGGTGHYLANYFPVRAKDGEPIGVGLVALDLTDLRHAERRERVFAEILEESRNEIYLFDAETLRFERVNRGARENLGYSMDELRSMTPLDLKPEFTPEKFAAMIEPLRRREAELVRFETVHRRRDGSLYPVDVHLQLSAAGERPLFVALILDSTERKRAERELIAAKEAAEQASQAKSQFLTVMSHELRTPLNAIIGYEDLMEAEVAGPITPKQREHLGRIKSGARQLLELINQILSLARIESGKEEVVHEAVDLAELGAEVASLMEGLAEQKALALRTRLPPTPVGAETDAGKVRQILLNLLGNAIKFTDAGEVELSLALRDGEAVYRVRDTGPGIPEHLQARVFEPFVQVDLSQTRRHGGTGLGLAVSRELARLLGGEISVESTPGSGSVFTLRLPVSSPTGSAASGSS